MGYYTNHILNIKCGKEEKRTPEKIFQIIKKDERFEGIFDELGTLSDDAKGYYLIEDMVDFSTGFPDVTFFIEGYGEEGDDHWKTVIKNGKHILVEAVLPELDLSLLEDIKPIVDKSTDDKPIAEKIKFDYSKINIDSTFSKELVHQSKTHSVLVDNFIFTRESIMDYLDEIPIIVWRNEDGDLISDDILINALERLFNL